MPGYWVRRLDAIPTIAPEEPDDPDWYPLQHHFALTAFGANIYTASRPGIQLLGEHDETGSGHEELYVVIAGSARFQLGGEAFDAPAVTVVAVTDPAVQRGAVAAAAGTTIVAIGAPATERFVSSWAAGHFEGIPRAGGEGSGAG